VLQGLCLAFALSALLAGLSIDVVIRWVVGFGVAVAVRAVLIWNAELSALLL